LAGWREGTVNSLSDAQSEVLDVVQRESAAFWTQDEATFLSCRANSPDVLRWGYWQGGGMFVRQGSNAILAASIAHMRNLKRPLPELANAEIANVVVHVSETMAWVRLDRLMPYLPEVFGHGPNGTIHVLTILERIEGKWLIVATVLLDPHLGDEVAVRVVGDGKVIWTSTKAALRLGDDPDYVVRNGKLRLRDFRLDRRLQSAIGWAAGISGPLMPRRGAVPLVVDDAPGAMRVSWVLADDVGTALVILDDIRPLADRVEHAAQVFGLSPVQFRVALAVSDGKSLVEVAADFGISLNTARTHLRRIFEKTGVSNQPALVAALLSLTPPR
jgi:DNA-binding CsgD family transcriptional regulator